MSDVSLSRLDALHLSLAMERYLADCPYDVVGESYREALDLLDVAKLLDDGALVLLGRWGRPAPEDREMDDYLTRDDFASAAGVSTRTVRRRIASGELRETLAGIPTSELRKEPQ